MRLDLRTGVSRSIRPPQAGGGRGGGGDDEMPGVPQGGPVGGPAQGPAGVQGRGGQTQAPQGAPASARRLRSSGASVPRQRIPRARRARRQRSRRRADAAAVRAGRAVPAIASTGTRRTSSARTTPRRLYWASNYVYRTDDRGDSLDAHQPGSLAQPRRVQHPDHGQGVAARLGRAQHLDDAAQQRRVDRRIAAARRAALRRHRRRAAADHRGRREELAEGRGLPRRAEVDLRHRRVRVAARRRYRVRHAQQLAARRLQAVRREEHRPRQDVDEHHRRTCPTSTTRGRSSQDHVNGNLLFAGTEFGAVRQRRRRQAVDAADAAACRRSRCAT